MRIIAITVKFLLEISPNQSEVVKLINLEFIQQKEMKLNLIKILNKNQSD